VIRSTGESGVGSAAGADTCAAGGKRVFLDGPMQYLNPFDSPARSQK
jgi:hypothetical protein